MTLKVEGGKLKQNVRIGKNRREDAFVKVDETHSSSPDLDQKDDRPVKKGIILSENGRNGTATAVLRIPTAGFQPAVDAKRAAPWNRGHNRHKNSIGLDCIRDDCQLESSCEDYSNTPSVHLGKKFIHDTSPEEKVKLSH